MLTLSRGQVECLWDEVLPVQARELPEDLARLDRVLSDPVLLRPVEQAWECSARERGRPSISIATFVRLMVVKQRTGWGYETLMREVSDSLHLRRFCLIAIDQRVPEESTVRKLARRLGAEVVQEITRVVIEKAQRETRFLGRAARIDSTVVEADIRYPSDAMLALQGVRVLAREGKKLAKTIKRETTRITDRSRSVGRTVRLISRTLARRTGEAKAQVMKLNEQAGRLIARSVREAQRLARQIRAAARGRGAQVKLRAAMKLEQLTARCQRVTEQIDRRARGLKDHRPARLDQRSGRAADPQGQAWQADRVWVRRADLRSDREHPKGRSWVHPAGWARAGQPGRESAATPDRPRARTCRHPAERDRLRWRLPGRPHQRRVPRPRRAADPAFRPPRARITQNPQAPGPLPNRDRGPHQPPQAQLRATPNQAKGR
jgi:IS5 family transposase